MALRALPLAALLALASCLPTAAPTPSPSAAPTATATAGAGRAVEDMTARLLAKPIPPADGFSLVRRLKGRDGVPARPYEPVRTTAPEESVGTSREFWVYDFAAKRNVRITAGLRLMTPSAKWWLQSGVTLDERALAQSAQVFEDRIYPTDRRIFGEEWSPGIDGDPRINILLARLPGSAAGYFSPNDAVPLWVNEFSAEREMIYLNTLGSRLGTDGFHAVLAHEFCHMIQFNGRVRSSTWFNEGFAQLCERANGYAIGFEHLFLRQPDTQLDAWSDLDEGAAQHYGAAFLFLEYLRHRTGGGYDLMNALLRQGVDTLADVDRALRAAGHPGVEEMFADFVVANALIGAPADAKWTYPAALGLRSPARPTAQDQVALGGTLRSSAHPQAARYLTLPATGPYTLRFEAPAQARVVPTTAASGDWAWWSDRADGMDSTMTREVDLGGVRSATLVFRSWFDIEPDFDYAYVAVSTDGGGRWQTLRTGATTTSDPNGNNLGNGMTGRSGGGATAEWIEQRADLSAYAGRKVLLRFEHVTDGALNHPGLLVDDIEIPEIGYRDDAEVEGGWAANGFIRSTNVVRQRYLVQVIRSGERPTVERHVVEGGVLRLDLDPSGDRAAPILAVSPLAPRVTQPVTFEVQVAPRR